MSIKTGKVVNLSYSLKNSKGEMLDQADQADPFVYLHGAGQIVPGLETALEGLKIGDKKKVVVSAAEGYGELMDELKLTVKRDQFPDHLKLEPGMQFETKAADGQGLVFTVESVSGDEITIDGNHPLAGQELHFDVEVLSMRDATEEETEHGHAHGDDDDHGGHGHGHGHSH